MAIATLEGTIHTKWAAKTTLNGLLDSANFVTGLTHNQDPPYCTLSREGSTRNHESSRRTRIDLTVLRFVVHHADYDLGRAIHNAIIANAAGSGQGGFHGERFDITNNGAVVAMVKSNDFALQDPEDGLWAFTIDFDVTRQLA